MKLGILIGRFQVQEPHEGHRFLFSRILEECDNLLILVGSSNKARSVRNPFTFKERKNSILKVLKEINYHYKSDHLQSFGSLDQRTFIAPLNDYLYSDTQWMADVTATIESFLESSEFRNGVKYTEIALYGHFKEGNDYLNWFPQFKYVNIESDIDISATEIRQSFRHLLPKEVQQDMVYYEAETAKFSTYPYPESLNFNCADAVVECLGHVLLIQRGHPPGIGTWALPGGFKNANETFLQAAIRELLEETNIRVPKKVLMGSIKSTRLFDNPKRSNGIPRNTLAVHIVVEPNQDGSLPRANGGDDAVNAKWVPITDALNNYALYDDHGDIISAMTGVMPLIAYNNPNIQYR